MKRIPPLLIVGGFLFAFLVNLSVVGFRVLGGTRPNARPVDDGEFLMSVRAEVKDILFEISERPDVASGRLTRLHSALNSRISERYPSYEPKPAIAGK